MGTKRPDSCGGKFSSLTRETRLLGVTKLQKRNILQFIPITAENKENKAENKAENYQYEYISYLPAVRSV